MMWPVNQYPHDSHLILDLRLGIFTFALLCQLLRECPFFRMQFPIEPNTAHAGFVVIQPVSGTKLSR
ncbi:hypothetical protein PI86_07900 [Burkholderia sp. A9]|nr:hypothetical protein PI86_07900 [Burkholderia sp. A9]